MNWEKADELAAEKIMGWHKDIPFYHDADTAYWFNSKNISVMPCQDWQPHLNEEQAAMVRDALVASDKNLTFLLSIWQWEDKPVGVTFTSVESWKAGQAKEPTVAEATLLAALRAIGVGEEEIT